MRKLLEDRAKRNSLKNTQIRDSITHIYLVGRTVGSEGTFTKFSAVKVTT